VLVDQSRAGVRSPLHYLDLAKQLRDIYAESEDARALGVDESRFSEGCAPCKGRGMIRIEMGFLPDVEIPCETCRASGHLPEIWEVRVGGLALPELYTLTLDGSPLISTTQAGGDAQARVMWAGVPGAAPAGLCYPAAQRLKSQLSWRKDPVDLFWTSRPSDSTWRRQPPGGSLPLGEQGGSPLVIEHHPHLLAACDWLVELGPGGGPQGGRVIATGTPEQIAQLETPTASYLRQVLEGTA
jgi:excinuclease ABC subunit A